MPNSLHFDSIANQCISKETCRLSQSVAPDEIQSRRRASLARAWSRILPTLACCLGLTLSPTFGQLPDALPEGELPRDIRLEPLKDLDGYFPLQVPASLEEWEERAESVRQRLLVSLGLWPMPERTPLNAVLHGKIELDDYSVERVYFEAMPGFFVTGSLYRPIAEQETYPAVLCPHGHWSNGRFYDAGAATAENEIKSGAEQTAPGARSPLQARCVQLARMGCIVFHYDMIGYADSRQISEAVAHRFSTQRAEMNRSKNYGLFSPQAESHLQSVMGLQTFSSIRALDFLESLPQVDRSRLAVTGASGGGTQTFILAAIDPRPAVAFPAVMVSTAMQGGCTCENCSLLRVETGNVEFAALFAPKPLALSAANDWTVEMQTKGFPELQSIYELYSKPDHVSLIARTEFGHNYNHVCRSFMYQWFNQHLHLNADPVERDFARLTVEQMTVWNDQHPRPEGGESFERELLAYWSADVQHKLSQVIPQDRGELDRFRDIYGKGIDCVIGRRTDDYHDSKWEQSQKEDHGGYFQITGLLTNDEYQEQLPLTFLYPKEWNQATVVWLSEQGKLGLFDESGKPTAEVARLLEEEYCVVGIDLLYQGEFLTARETHDVTRKVSNPREAAAYTFGYNHSLLARRVHDVLHLLSFMDQHENRPAQISLLSLDATAPIAAAATAQGRDSIDGLMIDLAGFRFGNVDAIHDLNFLPGGAKYGDVFGMLAIASPSRMKLVDTEPNPPELLVDVYEAAGAQDKCDYQSRTPQQRRPSSWVFGIEEIVTWLNQQRD